MTASPSASHALPTVRDLFYGGEWHTPAGGYVDTLNPATGESLGPCANAVAADVEAAVAAALQGYAQWRPLAPSARAACLREAAVRLRAHAAELAWLDATNCGSPVHEMERDVRAAAAQFDFFAGLVTEIKGDTIPMGDGVVNLSVREPYGVVGRIVAYNHPLMFTAAKSAAPLAAGNVVIMKPPVQAPMSAYRLVELLADVFPPGVLNVLTGDRECGEALVAHPDVPVVSLIGSLATGRAVARSAAERLKRVTLELGGKNACIVYPDADLDRAAEGAVHGMNFTWSGQSCGSTSRLFVHDSIHDALLERILQRIRYYEPGLPTDPATTMGAIVSRAQLDKIQHYIRLGQEEGAHLAYGGTVPDDPRLAKGFFIRPTVFTGVTPGMRIAREEIFGPVLSVLRWTDEADMLAEANAVEYGLTAAIFTRDLGQAHRAASAVEAGFVWVNHAGPHYLGTSYGGYKQSGIGRDESIEELLNYTQGKNINIRY